MPKRTESEVRSALWFLWYETPPNLRREIPKEVADICDDNWRDVESITALAFGQDKR